MDLRCRKTVCKYNNHYTCHAPQIKITNDMVCKTYDLDSTKEVPDSSRCLFEEAPKYAPTREHKKYDVDCEAKCIFNECGRCIANGITVNSLKDCPYCITYLRP